MMTGTNRRAARVAAILLVISSAPAAAQTQATPSVLRAEAEALYNTPSRYREAATLHERAAQVSDAADPKRMDDLAMASRLYVYAGDVKRALVTMEQAAQAALAAGEMAAAGNLSLDAAFLAQRVGDRDGIRRFMDRAAWSAGAVRVQSREGERLKARLAFGSGGSTVVVAAR